MCNLCSGRLFLVPNPCCCCDLRCGVIWAGFSDIVVGLISLYFPLTISVENKREIALSPENQGQDLEPIFDVSIPWLEEDNYITYCCTTQFISGIMIICAAYGMGGHKFSRFLLGCTWMIFRILMIMFLLAIISHLIDSEYGPLKRYGLFTILHVVVDIYLFIIVRYYTMECYDAYRYENIFKSLQIRRAPPVSSKTAPKTRKGFGKRKKNKREKRSSWGDEPENGVDVRNMFQKRRDLETGGSGTQRVPVWDRKNEVIFYGEDYTEWDPSVFQARWEMLNEKEKEETEKAKVAKEFEKLNVAGLALALLKSIKTNAENESEGQSAAAEGKHNLDKPPTPDSKKFRGSKLHNASVGHIRQKSHRIGHQVKSGRLHPLLHRQPGNTDNEENDGEGQSGAAEGKRSPDPDSKKARDPSLHNASVSSRIHKKPHRKGHQVKSGRIHPSLHHQPGGNTEEEDVNKTSSNFHWISHRDITKK